MVEELHGDGGPRVRSSNTGLLFMAMLVGLLVLVFFSLNLGRYPVPPLEILRIVLTTSPLNATQPYSNTQWVVVEIVRLPRILAVTMCGMGLALAGAAAQGIFRNPLVSPEIMGVSAGASLGGAVAMVLSWSAFGIVGLAFVAGFIALVGANFLSRLGHQTGTLNLVLAGIIVGAFCGAALGLIEYTADPQTQLPSIVYWLLGSFVGTTYQKVAIVAGATLIGGTMLLALSWRINILSLGDVDAAALGINVGRLRWGVIALISLLVAAQVSISGIVGWAGLIVPHMARMLVGPEHTKLLPAAALLGGIFLLATDDIARSATSSEIPIGLLTALLGTPVFAFLFYRQQTRGWIDE